MFALPPTAQAAHPKSVQGILSFYNIIYISHLGVSGVSFGLWGTPKPGLPSGKDPWRILGSPFSGSQAGAVAAVPAAPAPLVTFSTPQSDFEKRSLENLRMYPAW